MMLTRASNVETAVDAAARSHQLPRVDATRDRGECVLCKDPLVSTVVISIIHHHHHHHHHRSKT